MKIQRVREIARERGLDPGKAERVELIKAIQRQEGNFDCFASAYAGLCDQTGCRWREDCFAAARSGGHS
ncbi:MAG: SAP domain-containing protein [Candidatus Muproteobacteria bacterium RIFCSPHIGHO2_12_FULL_60_33]|uniref:SAP domain-containing protein n=1 Tax=Candidatus Muproteobacteria bacterium RIFCSPLOWO2_01_FULL_60_18 TaxID=1817768 RepID=A0A1F6U4S1_9PROT|nr:MAG: SAP domain-containing protein [Candidatus Muproteobacteria bacterium RIFCSPHIGHO2_01_60_12]OGI52396.1 MAG: SAP domain-containing protein [Candidatus Muproteobacteria bacterium RIFCSPLOWO2_01_FULL_60_18]OGI55798.1 MAG: SAP domain-containing protein [Candidatus Muproteobacteria bacterium RIFCSPHIGHO2_12_FULL_60_33]OGI56838.1 MAG: SAP domain-containing protein [Candidatus Muproteobacteria bacterium RIFCSPHIGHO2_02_FULL_60_13]OGI57729.1 MAG: SAP domain-containing protein [Candidatus Muprote